MHLPYALAKFYRKPISYLYHMSDSDYLRSLEIQRRNFEQQFGSLESLGYTDKSKTEHSHSSASEDDFGGFSAEDSDSSASGSHSDSDSDSGDSDNEGDMSSESEPEVSAPQVVKLADSYTPVVQSKADRKLARLGRAPTLGEIEKKNRELEKLSKKQQAKAEKEDSENVENDLKLQRLLSESHILAHNMDFSGADLTLQTLDYEAPIGNARRRILDQRIRQASALNSASGGKPKKLEKMPMNMRKGMIAARERRVVDYEREAREAGIILSKVKKGELRNLDSGRGATVASDRLGVGKKVTKRVRDRGLRIHSVGKSTRNGLKISQQEIDRVNNKGKRRRK